MDDGSLDHAMEQKGMTDDEAMPADQMHQPLTGVAQNSSSLDHSKGVCLAERPAQSHW